MKYDVLKDAIVYTSLIMGYIVILRACLVLIVDSIKDIYKHIKGGK